MVFLNLGKVLASSGPNQRQWLPLWEGGLDLVQFPGVLCQVSEVKVKIGESRSANFPKASVIVCVLFSGIVSSTKETWSTDIVIS